MAETLPVIFLLAANLFVPGVLSVSILTIENKCDHTVWPVIYSWTSSKVNSTGFALKKGAAREIRAPVRWYGLISGRTVCSTDTSTRNFSCATGDCESGKVECPGDDYSWSSATYAAFRLDKGGFDSYAISVAYGYNLPIMVVPSVKSSTCLTSGCVVDLNKTCPKDLMTFSGEKLIACTSPCQESGTSERCCLNDYKSEENCKPTPYTKNFLNACPLAYIDAYADNNSTVTCPNTTDYVITFCPTSFTPNKNFRSNNTTSMGPLPLPGETRNSHGKLKTILGVSTALLVMVIIVAIALTVRAKNVSTKSDPNNANIEAAVMLKRYSYGSVKKMTNSFAHVLGKGGSGTVYKGKLPDAGGDIALKILKESKGDGEEFINELASMSRASHVNIVSLFGFCNEGSNRAIIYEFMPNGSLDKFISKTMSTKMDWRVLYNIALGVAHGLEYLHNSCVSKIVHFDIKPQNILMDEDLCPKISDFGLAKLCRNKESAISLLNARGTIGYIAPEVFSKNFGEVSHKSDVYSYGMVVLEMIGAKNMKSVGNSRSDNGSMYFPDWIYEDLERKETMSFSGDHIIEQEEKISKKMALVGLWCIQTSPCDRPPMKEVVEMLEGSLEALQVPPKPLLNLPYANSWESVADSQETSYQTS